MITKTSRTMLRWFGRSLAVVAAAAVMTACVDNAPVGPNRAPTIASAEVAPLPEAMNLKESVDLGTCTNLKVEDGNELAFRTFAVGFQIYRWNGTSWTFVAPLANLYANAGANGQVGTHYVGPTWESNSG